MSTITARRFVSMDGTQEISLSQLVQLMSLVGPEGASEILFDDDIDYPEGSIGHRLLGEFFLNRQNHEGEQDISTITGLSNALSNLQSSISNIDIWSMQPVGAYIALADNLVGVSQPPTDKSYRYIKLTASDPYNAGILTSESVTGAAPLVLATAVVSDAASPINGHTINLINTERRFLRAGQSGILEEDSIKAHAHELFSTANANATFATKTKTSSLTLSESAVPSANRNNGTSLEGGVETRPRNIGTTYYMRIK